MLGAVLAEAYDVPRTEELIDRSLIGDHKHPPVWPEVPRIVQSHNTPSPIVHALPLRSVLRFPKYLVVTRDLRSSLVSHYEKHYAKTMDFDQYLRNSRIGAGRISWNLWHRIRFLNAWNRELNRLTSAQVAVVHYEAMQQDAFGTLRQIWEFMDLPEQADDVFHRAVSMASKDRMASLESDAAQRKIVRKSKRDPLTWFDEQQRAYFTAVCSHFLHNDFGYDYGQWDQCGPKQSSASKAA